jgi:hypothetical protein
LLLKGEIRCGDGPTCIRYWTSETLVGEPQVGDHLSQVGEWHR